MEELWKLTCFEGDKEIWTEKVILSNHNMRMLLKLLLCRTLEHHEIIGAVTGRNYHLLEIRKEQQCLFTAGPNLLHYTAQKNHSPK